MRQIASGDGENAEALHAAVLPVAESLVDGLRQEPEPVRRAIAWLATAFPDLAERQPELVASVPAHMLAAWHDVLGRVRARGAEEECDDEAALDRQVELEHWALGGWPG